MKPIFWILVAAIIAPIFLTVGLYAGTEITDAIYGMDEWRLFLEAIKGTKGLNTFVLIAAAVQAILLFIEPKFMQLSGRHKLLLVQSLTLVTGVATLKAQGFDWQSALVHSTTIGAFQSLIHQFFKEFRQEKDKYELPPSK